MMEGLHPRLHAPVRGERYVAGLDPAGEGEDADASVLTIGRVAGRRCEVAEHVVWRGAPFRRLRAEAAAIARSWRIERLCVDATGLGVPLAADLAGELGRRVEAVVFTQRAKSSMGYALIAAAGAGDLTLYADDGSREAADCRAELRECPASPGGHGGLSWGNASGHDDYVASLALCLRAAEELGPARVAVGHPPRAGHVAGPGP